MDQIVAVMAENGRRKTHRLTRPIQTAAELDLNARFAFVAPVICGEYVEFYAGWMQDAWDEHMKDYRRNKDTRERINVCRRCAALYEEEEL